MSEWFQTTIGEQATLQRGIDLEPGERREGIYPVIASGGVFAYHDRPAARGPGVLLGRKGTIGTVHFTSGDYWPYSTCLWVKDFHGNDPRFVYYFFRSIAHVLATMDVGSANPTLNRNHVHPIATMWPPSLLEQRSIADTLGALDDKVESNRRVVEDSIAVMTCEWAGADVRNAAHVALDQVARFVNGGAFTKGASGTGRMVIRIAELNGVPGRSTVYNDIDVEDDRLVRAGDLLMSWSGSLGVFVWSRAEAIVNQHIFKVIPEGYPSWLVYQAIQESLPAFRGIASDKATTMGHINRGHLHEVSVAIPHESVVADLDERLSPIWNRMLQAEVETHTLVTLRATLLQELLSGRLRVPESQEQPETGE